MRQIDILYMSALLIGATLSWYKRKFAPAEFRFLPFLLSVHFMVEGMTNYLMYHKVNNLFVYHAFTPIQYVLLASIYLIHFRSSDIRKYILGSMVLMPFIALGFALTIQPIGSNNSYANLVKNSFMVVWMLLYFQKLLHTDFEVHLGRSPLFLFSSILFVNLLTNLLIDLTMNYLIKIQLIELLYQCSLAVDIVLFIVIIWIYVKRIGPTTRYGV